MNVVHQAIETGRCSVAVSGSLLRDPSVMLALSERGGLHPMALSGPAVSPVLPVGETGLARACGSPGGVLVLVEPETADNAGVQQLARMVDRFAHKPKVVIVARTYNPFALGGALRGMSVDHHKGRGKNFLRDLPLPPADAPEVEAAPKPKKKKSATSDIPAPRMVFTGREEEMATLGELLGSGGPIVVSGPSGVGRTWLIEHAIAQSGLTRLPDLVLGPGSAADTLIGRMATVCKESGADGLATHLRSGTRTPTSIDAALREALQAANLDDKVMVIHDLRYACGRDGDFFRRSRMEVWLMTLLTETYGLRLIFTSTVQPVFYREAQGQHLRRLELAGIKGRFLHEIFEAYKAPEFPREKFGPISDRIHGHPLAARAFAIGVRNKPELLDDDKFLKLDGAGDTERLRKYLGRRVDKLSKPAREALAKIAHLRSPVTGRFLADLGIGRRGRLELLADGLLDMVGTEEDKRYRVHRLVRSHLSYREITDFNVFQQLGELYRRLAESSEGVERIAAGQEVNRCNTAGRAKARRYNVEFADHDPQLDSVVGMLRGNRPRPDLARQRLNEIVKRDPSNSDAWLLMADTLTKAGAEGEHIEEMWKEAADKAGVPEVYQKATGWFLARRQRVKAIELLEKGVEQLPGQSRLRTRLASLLLRQGRRKEAIEHLEAAMELDPMLPDAYGLLGMARRDEGIEALPKAESLLREAVRLAPDDRVQVSRLVWLLMDKALVEQDARDALIDEARELLDHVLRVDKRGKAPEIQLQLARLTREKGEDLERAGWLLKKCRKATERGHERIGRIKLEQALLDLARGELDTAETAIRDLVRRDPSNHKVFAALSKLLEARQLYIPAHAELLRAVERTSPNSLRRQLYDRELARLQALIEAQAAGLIAQAPEPSGPVATQPIDASSGHQRVIRRRKKQADEPATEAEAAPEEAAPAEEAAAEEAPADVEAALAAPEEAEESANDAEGEA